MSASPLLQLTDARRILAGRPVVEGLNLTLQRGQILGLLGVNGAGKTTTLRMIAGVLAPTSGQVCIDGEDLRENPRCVRRKLGYLPEQVPGYDELRVIEYLDFCARVHGLRGETLRRALSNVIERCELGEVRRRLLGNLSRGFRQRVGIAQAIVHDPSLIVLDEPASGLDPLQSANIRSLIADLGTTHGVILSTHLLADVQACCDRVVILHQGRVRHDGPLQSGASSLRLHVRTLTPVTARQWRALDCVREADPVEDGWSITLADKATPARLAGAIVGQGWDLAELRPEVPGLEEIFLRVASRADTESDVRAAA